MPRQGSRCTQQLAAPQAWYPEQVLALQIDRPLPRELIPSSLEHEAEREIGRPNAIRVRTSGGV